MKTTSTRGFTLIEIIVVIGIIAILSAIVFASFSDARKNARDKARISDIEMLTLALRLYVSENGYAIDCRGGLKIDGQSSYSSTDTLSPGGVVGCADGDEIISFINAFNGSVPADPRGPGNPDYFYYFDNEHSCASTQASLLFAVNLESQTSNVTEVCGTASGNNGGYLNTTEFGGSIDPSQPYVKRLNFASQI